jgi:methionyl-tRNA formyltransferase
LTSTAQPDAGAVYAAKITKEEAALDFTQAAPALERKIRAFNPFPGASAGFNGVPVKLWRARALPGPAASPGQVLTADAESGVVIGCGEGRLRVTELQKPGGKRLPAAEFLKGFPMTGGRFEPM